MGERQETTKKYINNQQEVNEQQNLQCVQNNVQSTPSLTL